jgi:hypothetical protein
MDAAELDSFEPLTPFELSLQSLVGQLSVLDVDAFRHGDLF